VLNPTASAEPPISLFICPLVVWLSAVIQSHIKKIKVRQIVCQKYISYLFLEYFIFPVKDSLSNEYLDSYFRGIRFRYGGSIFPLIYRSDIPAMPCQDWLS
jgi:hypothetical protein